MDKRFANIETYTPGIVIFDPAVLNEFLRQNNVVGSNIFERFLSDVTLGWSAIEQGVLIPIYEIPEDEDSIFIDDLPAGSAGRRALYEYTGLPLKVASGLAVVSDLNTLFDLGPDFFMNYKTNYTHKLASNDYLDVACGLFEVTVRGYTALEDPFYSLGYGLQFKATESLPRVDEEIAVDDRDFTLQSKS